MLEKGFLRNQANQNRKHGNVASTMTKTLLYLGVLILIISFVFLLANLDNADRLVSVVLPFIVAGLGLIAVSQFVKRAYNKLRK